MEIIYFKSEEEARKQKKLQKCETRLYYMKELGWELILMTKVTWFNLIRPDTSFLFKDEDLFIFHKYSESLKTISTLQRSKISKYEKLALKEVYNQLKQIRDNAEKK